ncbi:MAG: rod shape-determining protein MreC [Tissierellia bacterium]|nr:rod shape-determining protein MreC [Tissierellia bacterium]
MLYHRKRKSNKKFFITVIILFLIIFVSSLNSNINETSSNIANTVLEPLNKVLYQFNASIKNSFEDVFGSRKTRQDVNRLEKENKELTEENANLKSTINKEQFLKDEYEAINNSDSKYIKSFVINKNKTPYTDRFNIDKGEKDGIEKGDIVLQAIDNEDYYTGIIGKIVSVGHSTSTVETLISSSNNVSFVNSESGDYGIINSFFDGKFEGYMLEIEGEVNKGDVIVTGGIGGVYPRNYYIGKVSGVDISQDGLKKQVTVNTDIDFTHLYRVLVLKTQGEENE